MMPFELPNEVTGGPSAFRHARNRLQVEVSLAGRQWVSPLIAEGIPATRIGISVCACRFDWPFSLMKTRIVLSSTLPAPSGVAFSFSTSSAYLPTCQPVIFDIEV